MRIRRCASRVLGSSASAPALPRLDFELPPPSPPPAHEPRAGFVAASGTSSCSTPPERCEESFSPWDLMGQLHPSDPQEEKIFFETYFVAVAWRASWLFAPSIPATGSIKEEEEDMAVDVVDGVIFGLHVRKKNAVRKKTSNKGVMKPNTSKEKIKAEESDFTGGGGTPVWTCKRNGGKKWFCRRPVSQPNSLCSYHSDKKPKRKRATDAGEDFYFYAGFGPSRSKRHRVSSSIDEVPEPPPAGQKEEAPPDPEEHTDFSKVQAQADDAGHQPVAPASVDGTAGIAGWDEESSDDDAVKPRDIKMKSPLKKRWRKPVKARSLKSLMY